MTTPAEQDMTQEQALATIRAIADGLPKEDEDEQGA